MANILKTCCLHLSLFVFMLHVRDSVGSCPNLCSGHGDCSTPDLRCNCWQSNSAANTFYSGGDCSRRSCARGNAWSDVVTATDTAHASVECSNAGHCDVTTGMCSCLTGFIGLGCNRMSCPDDCSGHGTCKSMRYNAAQQDSVHGVYGYTPFKYDQNWDAEMMYGCVCDEGYSGHNCILRNCPYGDDPMTTGQVNEKQTISCTSVQGSAGINPAASAFTITYRGATTREIKYNDPLTTVATYLNALTTVTSVTVTGEAGGACLATSGQPGPKSIEIEFTGDFGDLPLVTVTRMNTLDQLTIMESQKGTKENLECSGRGVCDTVAGTCTCADNFASGDGAGNAGQRGDCGFIKSSPTSCPGPADSACNGHGICTPATFVCICFNGFSGADCSLMTCPEGPSWFDSPIADQEAHQQQECSNMGLCNRDTGTCECSPNFETASCAKMKCPGTPACSGHGQCITMAEMAQEATDNGDAASFTYGNNPNLLSTWDKNSIQLCKCDPGYEGYDCSLMSCPKGDDPMTRNQVNEKQHFTCDGTTGFFKLTYKQQTTANIPATSTIAQVKAALEALSSIKGVAVHFSYGTTVCAAGASNVVGIEFTVEHGGSTYKDSITGNLAVGPSTITGLGYDALAGKLVFAATSGGKVTVGTGDNAVDTLNVLSTKEMNTCSDRGICDQSTGVCTCFAGHGSSNGNEKEGNLGDCAYIEPYSTGNT